MAKNKIERIDQEIAKTREKMRSSRKCFISPIPRWTPYFLNTRNLLFCRKPTLKHFTVSLMRQLSIQAVRSQRFIRMTPCRYGKISSLSPAGM